MSEDNKSTTKNRNQPLKYDLWKYSKNIPTKGRQIFVDKFGFNDEEFEEYKSRLVKEYELDTSISVSDLVAREAARGRKMTIHRLSRWIKKAGVHVRYNQYQDEPNTVNKNIRVDRLTDDALKAFDNQSDVMRMAIRWALGVPERSILIRLDDTTLVLCLYDITKDKYNVFLTNEIPDYVKGIITNTIQLANEYGPNVIKDFCLQNDFLYLGGQDIVQELSGD